MFGYLLVPDGWVVGRATNNGGNVLRWPGRVAGGHLARAALEGFARSPFWRELLAEVLETPVDPTSVLVEQASKEEMP